MTLSHIFCCPGSTGYQPWLAGLFAAALLGGATAAAQPPVPIEGTIALQGTIKDIDRAANIIIVTTIDGVEHAYHFTKGLVVHGGKGTGVDALEGLRRGAPVVVHSTIRGEQQSADEIDYIGDNGLKATEGVVTHIDRKRKQITIRFGRGETETFRLTDRAAVAAGTDITTGTADGTSVIIYYSDEAGEKVAHYFTKTPQRRRP